MSEADYGKLYSELFNGITEVIEELKNLQRKTEELFISAEKMVFWKKNKLMAEQHSAINYF